MNRISPSSEPPRVPPVDVDLLGSAIFIFSEYFAELAAAHPAGDGSDADDEEADEADAAGPVVETRAVLDRFAEELGTDPATTLNLWLRVTALLRLLAASAELAALASDGEGGDGFSEDALAAAARLDLHAAVGGEAARAFDEAEFRAALEAS